MNSVLSKIFQNFSLLKFKVQKRKFKIGFSSLFFQTFVAVLFGTVFFTSDSPAQPFFDYDQKADLGVFRPSERNWYAFSSESKISSVQNWGLETDELVPADFDGDGLTDLAVWRAETGVWYVLRTRDGQMQTVNWGARIFLPTGSIDDEPVPGDYDGDGNDDFAVWRPDTGVWYILKSTDGFNPQYAVTFKWGKLADIPVPADYDGDRLTDMAVFRPTENRWYIYQSSNNQWKTTVFGRAGHDLLVPNDYTGDGKTDPAIYRLGAWLIQDSATGQIQTFRFGLNADLPVPADYNGDSITDLAVFRQGVWFVFDPVTQQTDVFNYGTNGDIPLPYLKVKPSIVPIP